MSEDEGKEATGELAETSLEISPPDVKAQLTFTKEDVVKIKYAKEELRLIELSKALQNEVKQLKEQGGTLKKKIDGLLEQDERCGPADLGPFADILRKLGAVEIVAKTERSLHDAEVEGEVEVEPKVKVIVGIAISELQTLNYRMDDERHAAGDYRFHEAYRKLTHRRPNAAEEQVIAALDKNSNLISARTDDLYKTKEAIGSLPVFMRQLEAAMASYVLASTSEGRTLMQAVEDVESLLPKALEAAPDASA